MKFTSIVGAMVGLTMCGAVFAAEEDATKDDAIAMVNKAVALIKEKGDAALALIGDSEGAFYVKENDLYAFVYDPQCVITAHPYKPALVGKSFKGKPDVKGKMFRDEIVETALSKGSGWVEYSYQKPSESGIYQKIVYCKLVEKDGKKHIVASGVYKPKDTK